MSVKPAIAMDAEVTVFTAVDKKHRLQLKTTPTI